MAVSSNNTAPNRQANAYLRTQVMSASPEELRLMLLDGAIKFLRQGRESLAQKDYEGSYNGLSQSRDIVLELLTTIRGDLNPELAGTVKSLYTFIYTQIVDGGFEKDLVKIDSAVSLLEYERETWVMLMQKLQEERTANAPAPIPMPAQTQSSGSASRVPFSAQA